MDSYCISPKYQINQKTQYFKVQPISMTFQPYVYQMAEFICQKEGFRYLIDIGDGNGQMLARFSDVCKIFTIDFGDNYLNLSKIEYIQTIDWNLENVLPSFDENVLENAIVIVADIIEHLRNPDNIFKDLSVWSRKVRYLLISTPDRSTARGIGNLGPPDNDAPLREWTIDEFSNCLTNYRIDHPLIGHTIISEHHNIKQIILAISGVEPNPVNTMPAKCLASINIYMKRTSLLKQ